MKLLAVVVTGLIAATAAASALAVRGNPPISVSSQHGIQSPAAPTIAITPMTASERKRLTALLEAKWGGYVEKVYGTPQQVWAQSLAGTFATADSVNLRRAATMSTYEGALAMMLGQTAQTDQKVIDTLAMSTSASTMETLGSPAGDLVYTMITPCRIFDTRLDTRVGSGVGGVIPVGGTHHFEVSVTGGATFAPQGGGAGACGIPASPSAVVMNVTVLNPLGGGNITVFPYGVAKPAAVSLNYPGAGSKVGNEIIAKATIGSLYDISIYSVNQTDVVGDAVGYFMAPIKTELDSMLVQGPTIDTAAGAAFTVSATCLSGYAVTGGGNFTTGDTIGGDFNLTIGQSYPVDGVTWTVRGKNTDTISNGMFALAQCSRIPGR